MEWLGFLWLMLLVALGAWLLGLLLVAASWRLAGAIHLSPRLRARRVMMLAALPWILPAAMMLALGLIAITEHGGLINDHCLNHPHRHLHLCFTHLPVVSLGLVEILSAALIAIFFGVNATQFFQRERYTQKLVANLSHFAESRGRFKIVEDLRPFAFASGIRRPLVIFSRGLLQHLSFRERRIVMAHELGHLRHADPLRNVLLDVLLCIQLPAYAGNLRQIWLQAREESADDCAVNYFGRDAVTATLLQVIKINRGVTNTGFSLTGADPLQRIRRLLAAPEQATTSRWFESFYLAVVIIGGVLMFTHHHAVEIFLSRLVGV